MTGRAKREELRKKYKKKECSGIYKRIKQQMTIEGCLITLCCDERKRKERGNKGKVHPLLLQKGDSGVSKPPQRPSLDFTAGIMRPFNPPPPPPSAPRPPPSPPHPLFPSTSSISTITSTTTSCLVLNATSPPFPTTTTITSTIHSHPYHLHHHHQHCNLSTSTFSTTTTITACTYFASASHILQNAPPLICHSLLFPPSFPPT